MPARTAGCAPWAAGGWRPASSPVSGIGSSGSVPGPAAADAAPLPCVAMPGGSACCIAGWSTPPLGSPTGGGVAVRCGGPCMSSAPTVGSSRCGWIGAAGGVAALSAGCAASQASPSDTDGSPGRFSGSADRGASAWTVVRAGSGPGSRSEDGRPGDDCSVGLTAGLAGWGVVSLGRRFGLCRGRQVPLGPLCRMSPELGDLGSRWGRGLGGARCRHLGF